MSEPAPYRWASLADFDQATTWCNRQPAQRLEGLNLQGLMLLVSDVLEEGFRLCRNEWNPSTGEVPTEVEAAFVSSLTGCHDVLLLCAAAAHRASPDCVQPPPSRPVSVATLASRLAEARTPLPSDVASALLELEWARQMVITVHFGPHQRAQRSLTHLNARALEGLVMAVGVVLACVESGLPWVSLP